jgi:hypothetical protein
VKKEEKGGKRRENKFVFLLFFGMILLLIQNECIHIISYLLTKKEKKWKEKGKKGIYKIINRTGKFLISTNVHVYMYS